MFTMVATLQETRKHFDWPSLAKISTLSRCVATHNSVDVKSSVHAEAG